MCMLVTHRLFRFVTVALSGLLPFVADRPAGAMEKVGLPAGMISAPATRLRALVVGDTSLIVGLCLCFLAVIAFLAAVIFMFRRLNRRLRSEIAEHRRSEQRLAESVSLLEATLESTDVGILIADTAGRITRCNKRFQSLWSIGDELLRTRTEAELLTDHALVQLKRPARFMGKVKHLLAHPDEESFDLVEFRNGRTLETFSMPKRLADAIVGRVWSFRDVTDRKRMEAALRESEELYRRVTELSPEGIYIHSGGRFVYVNPSGARILGAGRPEELYGMVPLDFVHPDYREIVRQRTEHAEASRCNPLIEELFVRLDGTVVPVEAVSLHFSYRGIPSVLAIVRDMTEQSRMREELLKTQKLESLGVLAGGIAHDFNNILTGILGNLSLARIQLDPDNPVGRLLEQSEKASQRASELTRQLLTFARGGEPVKKLLDPAPLIREHVSFVMRGRNAKGIVSLADDLWPVEADGGQLSQVLHNILINAAQAMPGGGDVEVRAGNVSLEAGNHHGLAAGPYLAISVSDQGCGIPREHRARIFDPYFTTKIGGTGLGLASVYSIVKRHNGVVEVSSVPGEGSRFTICLPASPGQRPGPDVPVETAGQSGGGRILVMDDDACIRRIVAEILAFQGYGVDECADGREAVLRYRTAREQDAPFSAVILDLTVPGGMGGKESAARLLEIDPGAVLIVSSGYSNDPVVANYRDFGFSGAIPKPFSAAVLDRELKRLLA